MINCVRKYMPVTNAKSFKGRTLPNLLGAAATESRSCHHPHLLRANLELFKEVKYVVQAAKVGFEPRSV